MWNEWSPEWNMMCTEIYEGILPRELLSKLCLNGYCLTGERKKGKRDRLIFWLAKMDQSLREWLKVPGAAKKKGQKCTKNLVRSLLALWHRECVTHYLYWFQVLVKTKWFIFPLLLPEPIFLSAGPIFRAKNASRRLPIFCTKNWHEWTGRGCVNYPGSVSRNYLWESFFEFPLSSVRIVRTLDLFLALLLFLAFPQMVAEKTIRTIKIGFQSHDLKRGKW